MAGLSPPGFPELDDVLFGGLPRGGAYLVSGEPGTGKTTLALQFLLEGCRRGERCLFLTISQDRRGLDRIAASHGFDLAGMHVEEVSPLQLARFAGERQSVLDPADVELSSLMGRISDAVGGSGADRIVVDSLFELRLLSGDSLSYRRELLVLRDLVGRSGATALFLDYGEGTSGDRQLEGLANGALYLEQEVPDYGAVVRRMHFSKMRGHEFIGGHHDLTIRSGGIAVFPRVVPEMTSEHLSHEQITSGIDELDEMLGGGLQPGTTCLIVGQSGTGKSTLSTAYAEAASRCGKRAAMFLFEERPEIFRSRCEDLGFALGEAEDKGQLRLEHYNPAEVSPGEVAQAVVAAVEEQGVRVVVIDSLSGFLGALPNGRNLVVQMHSLLSYLSRRNVLTILTMTQHGLLGGDTRSVVDASFLANSAILLSHERDGADLRRTVTVLKKRHGDHEKAVRELLIGDRQVDVRSPETRRRPLLSVV